MVGVDAIAHTASPFHFHADDPDELIVPAMEGVKSVLASALKHGNTVKRIIITSSIVTMANPSVIPAVVDENDWNVWSVEEVRTKGRNANALDKYRASKVLAERAAWDLYTANKAKVSWDLVTVHPGFVMGPWLQDAKSVEELSQSVRDFYAFGLKAQLSEEVLATDG